MRVWLVMVLGVIFGCTAGAAMTWIELSRETVTFETASESDSTTTSTSEKIGPKVVVVGGTTFEAGKLPFDSSGSHTFLVQNAGDEPLDLHFREPSCGKCIQVSFPDTVVPPGGECEIVVNYSVKKEGPRFAESATFTSNDPRLNLFRLEISGVVTKPVRFVPPDLAFGTVSATDGATASVMMLGYHHPDISFTGHEVSNESLKDFFQVEAKTLTREQAIEHDDNASCGLELVVTAKPGLPLGPVSQVITVKAKSSTDTDVEHTLDLVVTGEVVGDITIIGKGFNAAQGMLALGLVGRGEGKTVNLFIFVKGQYRNDVKMSVGTIDPADSLRATIGEGEPVAGGKSVKYPLTIELLTDAPPQNHLGDARGKMGKIVIETTHPTAKEIPINVRFVIE